MGAGVLYGKMNGSPVKGPLSWGQGDYMARWVEALSKDHCHRGRGNREGGEGAGVFEHPTYHLSFKDHSRFWGWSFNRLPKLFLNRGDIFGTQFIHTVPQSQPQHHSKCASCWGKKANDVSPAIVTHILRKHHNSGLNMCAQWRKAEKIMETMLFYPSTCKYIFFMYNKWFKLNAKYKNKTASKTLSKITCVCFILLSSFHFENDLLYHLWILM